jgi:L-lactate dehydrogenase complex protein LldG
MSRDRILANVRRALGAPRLADRERRAAADRRILSPPAHPTPARVQIERPEILSLFRGNMRQQAADVIDAKEPDEVPGLVARYLAERNLPAHLRMGGDRLLAAMPWGRVPGLERTTGAAHASDTAALSVALAAVAETGTLILASGTDNPATLAFLPETHLVVVETEAIAGPFEAAFQRVRMRFGRGSMPRSLNLVSAPSRTGDIGGKIVLGAHGPRRLAVIIVGGAR